MLQAEAETHRAATTPKRLCRPAQGFFASREYGNKYENQLIQKIENKQKIIEPIPCGCGRG